MKDLTGKTIIDIGASGGLGSFLARGFSYAGANVVLFGRTESPLAALAQELPPERTQVVVGDAASPEDVPRLFKATKERFGDIDAVIHGAGKFEQISLNDPLEKVAKLARTHFESMHLSTLLVGFETMKYLSAQQNGGVLFVVTSIAVDRTDFDGNYSYGSSKAASADVVARLLKDPQRPPKVRITDLRPATVNLANAAERLDTPEKQAAAVQPDEILNWIADNLDNPNIDPIKRFLGIDT